MKTIRRGDRGEAVKTAQQLLNHKGYEAGNADSIFGENTEKAVRALQKNYGIAVDGIVGPDTWAALYAEASGSEAPKSAHFKVSEFQCHDGTEVPAKFYANLGQLMALLEKIRTACINSGYRTDAYNKKVGGAPLSQHLLAKAADIRVEGMTAAQVYDIANRLNPDGGVGKYASFTHVDVRHGRARW